MVAVPFSAWTGGFRVRAFLAGSFQMAHDDEDNLFDEEFDFVDEDDFDESTGKNADGDSDDDDSDDGNSDDTVTDIDDSEEEQSKEKPKGKGRSRPRKRVKAKPKDDDSAANADAEADSAEADDASEDQPEEEKPSEPEGPPTDHVVHVYELGDFKRTIQREFTAEDAEAFAVEYNRTAKPYSRTAIAADRESKPAPTL